MSALERLKKEFADYKKKTDAEIKKLRGEIKSKDPLDDFSPDDDSGISFDAIKNQVNRVNALTDAVKNLSQAGLNFKDRNALKEGASEAIEQIDLLLGSAKAGQKSFEVLAKGMQSFAEISKIAGIETKSLTGTLALHQAALKKAGLASQDFQSVVDITTFSLKGNVKEIENINLKLADFARQSGISTSQVSKNFQILAKNLMLDAGNIEAELMRTQKVEQQTGVSVQRQMASLSGVTTDFSAASSMAGNLNALLGGNKLSATELFMSLGPGEVQEKIRNALKGTRLEGDITETATDRISVKRRQLAIQTLSQNTGFTPDEVRRLYGLGAEGDKGPAGSAQAMIMATTDKTFDNVTQNSDKFGVALKQSTDSIQTFTKSVLQSQMTFRTLFDLEARRSELQQPGEALRAQQKLFLQKEFGTVKGIDLTDQAADLSTSEMQTLLQLSQASRIGLIDDNERNSLLATFMSNPGEGMKAIDATLQKVRKFPGAFTKTAGSRPESLGFIQRAFRRQFQGGIFGIGEAIRSGDFATAKKMLEEGIKSGAISANEGNQIKAILPKTLGGSSDKTVEQIGAEKAKVGNDQVRVDQLTGKTIVSTKGASASAFTVNRAVGGAIHSQTQVVLTLDGKTIAEVIAEHL